MTEFSASCLPVKLLKVVVSGQQKAQRVGKNLLYHSGTTLNKPETTGIVIIAKMADRK